MCIAADLEFKDLMQTFDTTDLEAWLTEAARAHDLFFAAHRGVSPFAGTNQRLEATRAAGQELWGLITRMRTM